MENKAQSDTNFTTQVKSLSSRIYGRSQLKDSILERALIYYENKPSVDLKLDELL